MARASSRWAWPEQALGEHRASSKRLQRGKEERKHLLNAQEVPPWHGEAVPVRPRWHQAKERRQRHVGNHLTRQAPDLAEDRAKQLEIKLEVAMAEVQSIGGEGDESAQGVINKISQTGRSTIAGSIDCDPSQRRTPAELVGIERGSGGATQWPGLG
jgi:hypothetical protein